MFNLVKMFVLLMFSFVLIQTPQVANAKTVNGSKNKKAVDSAKFKLKFDTQVYYKLSHKNRLKYLQVFADLAVQAEKAQEKNKKTASGNFYFELQKILFPVAEADGAVCLNGGIFYERPSSGCGSVIPESHRFANLTSYYTCGMEKRCAAYFGVDSSGQGFCYTSSAGATAECRDKSAAANGQSNLRDLLNNCSANSEKCSAFQQAMAADQAKIEQFCAGDQNSRAYCQAARTSIANFTSTPGVLPTAPATAMLDATSGCSEVNMQAVTGSGFGTLQRQLGFDRNVDSYWMYLASMAQHACGTYKDMQQVLKVVGVCQAPSSTVEVCTSEKEKLATCVKDIFSEGSLSDFEAKYKGLNTSRRGISVKPRTGFEVRNDIASGNLDGLEEVAKRLCPTQTASFQSCKASNSAKTVDVANPANVMLHLQNTQRFDAVKAVNSLVGGASPTSSQMGAFYDSFGITTAEFKSLFCANSSSDFRVAQVAALRARPSSGNPMRERMRSCMENSVRDTTSSEGLPQVSSNYDARKCSLQEITGVIPAQAQGYLYYEKETGYCRKASGLVPASAVPANQISAPCRSTDLVGSAARANQQYVRLQHAVAGGSDVKDVYACLDNLISSDKFDVYRSSCLTSDSSGDGPDSATTAEQ